ncbi:hypothetical protein EW146_g6138 [Bondarzewia mesenterica]|uniref:Uncharacterized protein n=1 Tax=Bondarzewia mesenterica TaxID=1095465 RepID=A0A4S4LV73_9AGAM|nr:hypothetical protein EW146_g6138 [Bondarzewia mesenterica]
MADVQDLPANKDTLGARAYDGDLAGPHSTNFVTKSVGILIPQPPQAATARKRKRDRENFNDEEVGTLLPDLKKKKNGEQKDSSMALENDRSVWFLYLSLIPIAQ